MWDLHCSFSINFVRSQQGRLVKGDLQLTAMSDSSRGHCNGQNLRIRLKSFFQDHRSLRIVAERMDVSHRLPHWESKGTMLIKINQQALYTRKLQPKSSLDFQASVFTPYFGSQQKKKKKGIKSIVMKMELPFRKKHSIYLQFIFIPLHYFNIANSPRSMGGNYKKK